MMIQTGNHLTNEFAEDIRHYGVRRAVATQQRWRAPAAAKRAGRH